MHGELSAERRVPASLLSQPRQKQRAALTDDRSWSVQDVAYFLNVSASTVRNLERDGDLPALPRIGTRIIFDPKVVRAFRDGWRPPRPGRPSGRRRILDDGNEDG